MKSKYKVLKLIILSLLLITAEEGFSDQHEVYILEGSSIVFRMDDVPAVKWFYKGENDQIWNCVGSGNSHTQRESSGSLFGMILSDSLTYTLTDTINFVEPEPNAADGLFLNNRFYKTVHIGDHVWMAEDVDSGLYTFEEALAISRSAPNWTLPSFGWKHVNGYGDPESAILQLQASLIPSGGNNSDAPLGLSLDGGTGFDFLPTGYEANSPYLNLDDSSAYYWHESYDGFGSLKINNYQIAFLTSNNDKLKLNVRLVKEPKGYNHPPSVPTGLWPLRNQYKVNINPKFTWSQAVDEDGDPVHYELHYMVDNNSNLTKTLKGITQTEARFPETILPDMKFGKKITWWVDAVDNYGASIYTHFGNNRNDFYTATDAQTPVYNIGEYGVQNLNLTSPQAGSIYSGTKIVLKWERPNVGNLRYSVYLGTSNPPPAVYGYFDQGHFIDAAEALENTTYYWKIEAKDVDTQELVAESEISSFTTGEPVIIEDKTSEEIDQSPEDKTEEEIIEIITNDSNVLSSYEAGANAQVTSEIQLKMPLSGATFHYKLRPTHKWFASINEAGSYRLYYRITGAGFDPNWVVKRRDFTAADINITMSEYDITIVESLNMVLPVVEWKIVFYDTVLEKETKQSETWTFSFSRTQLATPRGSSYGDVFSWDPIPDASGYVVVYETVQRNCSGGIRGNKQTVTHTVVTTETQVQIPDCRSNTEEIWATVKAVNYEEGIGVSDYWPLKRVKSCTLADCSSGGSSDSGDTGGGTGGSGDSGGTDSEASHDDFDNAEGVRYLVTWQGVKDGQPNPDKWYAYGGFGGSGLSEPTEDRAIDLVSYDGCGVEAMNPYKTSGKYRVYKYTCGTGKSAYDVRAFMLENGIAP